MEFTFKIEELNEILNAHHIIRNTIELKRKLGDRAYDLVYLAKQNSDSLKSALEEPEKDVQKIAENASKDENGQIQYTTRTNDDGSTSKFPKVNKSESEKVHDKINTINKKTVKITLKQFEQQDIRAMVPYFNSKQQDLFIDHLTALETTAKK